MSIRDQTGPALGTGKDGVHESLAIHEVTDLLATE